MDQNRKKLRKDVPVRISSRSLAQSIPEGLENKRTLTAKLKKIRNFFYAHSQLEESKDHAEPNALKV